MDMSSNEVNTGPDRAESNDAGAEAGRVVQSGGVFAFIVAHGNLDRDDAS